MPPPNSTRTRCSPRTPNSGNKRRTRSPSRPLAESLFGIVNDNTDCPAPPCSPDATASFSKKPSKVASVDLLLPSSNLPDRAPKLPEPIPRIQDDKENTHARLDSDEYLKRFFEPTEAKYSRPQNDFYMPPLKEPLLIPVGLSSESSAATNTSNTHLKQFIMVQSLKGFTDGPSRSYIAAYHPYKNHDFNNFVVLKKYKKSGIDDDLDPSGIPATSLRRELQVFKRLALGSGGNRTFLADIDASVENSTYHYLIMPLYRCDLAHVLMGKTSINRHDLAKAWITQMAFGLDCLHSRGIIHCNLKPTNVLVQWDGSVRIGDFACAYIDKDDEPLRDGVKYAYKYRGAEPYMAPEQKRMLALAQYGRGDYDEHDPTLKSSGFGKETDIWSLGCIAAELLRDDQYRILFTNAEQFDRFTNASLYDRRRQLERYRIGSHFQIQFLLGLLHPDPSQRTKTADFKTYDYYSSSRIPLNDVAARRLKDDDPEYALRCDLSVKPRPENIVRVNVGKIAEDESRDDHTWINPCGPWA